jgi:hypothetical protein
MSPTLSIPTDNIYKFACLFGLALIISSIFAFVSTYTASLDRKIKYLEAIIPLEANTERTKTENDFLAMNRKLIEVTKSNESIVENLIAVVFVVGIMLSIYGAREWYHAIQRRDDKLVILQLEKLEIEIEKLRSDISKPQTDKTSLLGETENNG